MVPTGQVLRWAIPAFSVQPCHGKAGEGTRTLDIQLGKLTTHHENDRESGILEGSSETPRSSHSSSNANPPQDDDLRRLTEAWPSLPSHIQAAIWALLDSAQPEARK